MKSSIGSFDAKTHLAEYLERVRNGEEFVITRRGTPVAELRPLGRPEELADLLDECREFRGRSAGGLDIVALIREDRSR